jgi:hypothetical protein
MRGVLLLRLLTTVPRRQLRSPQKILLKSEQTAAAATPLATTPTACRSATRQQVLLDADSCAI